MCKARRCEDLLVFAQTAAMPGRVSRTCMMCARYRSVRLLCAAAGRPQPAPMENAEELVPLSLQEPLDWHDAMLDLVQGAPA